MTKTVAIFGATGAQGAPVVTQALAQGLNVRAVARDLDKITQLHPSAQEFAATLDDVEAIAQALDGVDAAFFHLPMPLGPDDAQTWLTVFITAAHRVSLPLLVYTTSGPTGSRYASSVVIDGGTGGMQAVQTSGIPAIVLQPAMYLENLLPAFFLPRLRSEGVLDYPPMPSSTKVQWTSHRDQAVIAVAALDRPDLAGNAYEIGTPDALTGSELADLLSDWVGRNVDFAPISPAEFGQRIGDAIGSPGAAFALGDLYGSLGKLNGDDMVIDTQNLEKIFNVKLTSIVDHVAGWPKA
ncbi:MAG: NmrA family NAD(P)-binding protein [Stappiaceae bacterium]